MIEHKSRLRYQFRKQLFISIGLLVVVFSILLYNLYFMGHANATHRSMMILAEHYAAQLELQPDSPLPQSGGVGAYIGRQNLPHTVQDYFKEQPLNDYQMHIYHGNENSPTRYFMLAFPLNNSKHQLLVLYNDQALRELPRPSRKGWIINLPGAIALTAVLAIILVFWLAQRLISKVLNPLYQLSEMANHLDENNPELSFSIMSDKTEIGDVANTLHNSLQRIHQFHQREKKFLQNASHELRTPIAVVASSLDIIALRSSRGNQQIEDQLQNIRRSNQSMAELSEAILLTGRDQHKPEAAEQVNLSYIVKNVAADLNYLLEGKNVRVQLAGSDSVELQLAKTLCRIVLSNLIRNAFEHTDNGKIQISVSDTVVTIKDTGCGFAQETAAKLQERGISDGQGFGLGLDIVRQIVKAQQWKFSLQANSDIGTTVMIDFSSPLSSNDSTSEF
ncbi:sensor histidine kinase [Psychromonas ossibalaenae]|uniref:sensor histidine kinase n=1 Tax=Psychromonas ossibalaenae TaxID=444922 RepID=UPI00037C2FFA|nr:HAMP domain-containing sensor histidine kinase [Psychromonas ossibalaenae]